MDNAYIFIQTTKYFPFSAVSEGDSIQFQGYTPTTESNAASDFQTFIHRSSGHLVVATGHVDVSTNVLADGRNSQGFCNIIIIQNRFDDPSTGRVGRTDSTYFGGNSSSEQELADDLNDEANQTGAALINMSRQSHIVLRVITRDMDSSSNIRPDNV